MRANLRWVAAVGLWLGCARGAAVDELDGTTEDQMPLGNDADAGTAAPASPGDDHSGGASGADSSGGSGALGDRDAGRTPLPDATTPTLCPAPLSCEQAKAAGMPNLGSVAWSNTELIATKSEAGSRWYLVAVTGDSASEVVKGGIEARLTAPPGSNYDLFLYGGAKGYNSGLDTCEGPQASSQKPAGDEDRASQVWAAAAFGALSDRLVTVEVRHVDGPCANFTLELYGAKQ